MNVVSISVLFVIDVFVTYSVGLHCRVFINSAMMCQ